MVQNLKCLFLLPALFESRPLELYNYFLYSAKHIKLPCSLYTSTATIKAAGESSRCNWPSVAVKHSV